jgi:type I restriction enzyme S subunit
MVSLINVFPVIETGVPKHWEKVTFYELLKDGSLELMQDGNHGGYYPKPEEFDTIGIPIITGADLNEGTINLQTCKFLKPASAMRLRIGFAKKGDVLLTHKGTMGKTAIVPSIPWPYIILNPQITLYRVSKNGRLNGRYLKFFFDSEAFQKFFERISGISTISTLSLTVQKSIEIPLPPIAEQKAIASVLGVLDDKIEINRRMNATLEAMARALFKSWFVDFDPVRAKLDGRKPAGMDDETAALFPSEFEESSMGPIPKGWKVGSILQQAELLSGGTPKTDISKYWNGDIAWASAKDVSQAGEAFLISTERTITQLGLENSSTKIIPEFSTVIVSRGATTGRLTMFGSSMAMNQTCYGLRSRFGTPFSLYLNMVQIVDTLVNSAHGSIFDTITTRTFETTKVLLPPEKLQNAFEKSVSTNFLKVRQNLHQSQTLVNLRDVLLPKLLSGEISVSSEEVEQAVNSSSQMELPFQATGN